MADKKISELTALTGADTATDDQLVIVDTSAGLTKSITVAEFQNALDGSTGFVRITGDTMTGNLNMGDNVKAIFGAGSDLQIYHNSANNKSYIEESGTGNLVIRGSDIDILSGNGEAAINVAQDGAVTLYNDNNAKLATTSTGIDVTGTVTADGLTVDGAIAFNSTATFSDGSEARFGADNDMALFHSGGVNHIRVNSGTFKLRADDMRFTAQNGTSEFARFDSSGNFGIGEASPSTYGKLVVAGSTPFAVIRSTDTTTAGFSMLVNSGSNGVGSIGTDNGGHMTFDTGSTGAGQSERMRIKSTGEILHTLPSEDTTFAAGTDSTWNRLEIFQDRGAVNTASGIAFRSNSGTAPAGIVGVALNTTGGREELAFITSTGNASSEVMRLDENGNVGIGVTAPTGILSISGADTTSRPQLRFMTGEGTGLADAALSTTDDSGGTGLLIGSNLYYSGGSITRFSTSRSGSAIDFGYTGSMKFYTGSGNTAPDQKMTLDANGNVGIGTPSPSVETPLTAYYSATSQMHLGGPASIVSNNVYFNGSAWANRNSSVGGAMVQMTTDGVTYFRRAGTGASPTVSYSATIDASGNFLVGKTSTDYLTNGVEAKPDGSLWTTATNNGPLVATRKSSDGNIASFYKDSSFVGSIGVSGNDFYVTGSATNIAGTYFANSKIMPMKSGATSDNTIDLGTSSKRFKDFYLSGSAIANNGFQVGTTGIGNIGNVANDVVIYSSGAGHNGLRLHADGILPTDNTGALIDDDADIGFNTYRFKDIYATNGTIQTSDRNEKQDIAELSDAEQRVAVAAKGLLRKFRWKSAVEAKGDEARTHFGIIAQDLQAAFAAEGLDAGDYAMFISSTWTDEDTGEERTRMGVRYSELLAFIIAAI